MEVEYNPVSLRYAIVSSDSQRISEHSAGFEVRSRAGDVKLVVLSAIK